MKEFNILSPLKRIIYLIFISALTIQASFAQYQMENLDRGLVAVQTGSGVFLSWRMLGTDPKSVSFNIYRNGTKVNAAPITGATNMVDAAGATGATYTVRPIISGTEQAARGSATVWGSQVQTITLSNRPSSSHAPNDINVGDLDGDGQYELVVKWYPSNAKDNSQAGVTANTYLAAYKMNGTFLWIIDLGRNIRSGAHYTQHLVGDYDSDGFAEVACKTAPGTRDGAGNYLSTGPAGSDNDATSYLNGDGYILSGPEYLTIFNGRTGKEMATVNYPVPRGNVGSWGDTYGNRVDRFNATNAYLDGVKPSMIFQRGYYTRLTAAAMDWNGRTLSTRWIFDSNNAGSTAARGQGNHSVMAADIDGDGFDEILTGSACIDNDGKLKWTTGYGHGDANHVGDFDPNSPGLEVWQVSENKGSEPDHYMIRASDGHVLWRNGSGTDNGRGMVGDIDARYPGQEAWSNSVGGTFQANGTQFTTSKPGSTNFRVYWDGDLQDELPNGSSDNTNNRIDKWNGNGTSSIFTLTGLTCNGTKATPNIVADLFGDWREEIILHDGANRLYIHTTTIPTQNKMYTLMHDPAYRNAISYQQSSYNQPPHLSFWLGAGIANVPTPNITIVGGTTTGCVPTITAPSTAFCAGGSIVLSASTGASYKWFNGTMQVGTSATYTASTAGSYTVEVTTAAGCTATSTPFAITVNPLPVITQYAKIDAGVWATASTATVCEGSTVELGPHPNVAAGWNWTGPNNFTSAVRNPILTNSTSAQGGVYTATYTDANGCKANSDFILQISKPTATITAPATSFCTGESIVLTSSAGSSYKWVNGTTLVGTTPSYTATTAGSYTVEVTNAAGCKATSAVTQITVNPLPTATISSTATSFCAGGSLVLTASAGSSYKWFNGTTQVGTTPSYTATAAGAYAVEVTNAAGCKATSAVTQITVNPLPTATISSTATSFCAGGSVVLTSSAGSSYKWFNGTNQVGTTSSYTATTAGSYTVEVTNAAGCKATSAITQINVTATVVWYADTDNDGIGDVANTLNACTKPSGYVATAGDACPADANKTVAGACGCGNLETDTDSDGTPNCVDSDDDNDGIADANDCAPLNPVIGAQTIWYQDIDGDGLGDIVNTVNACTKPNGYVAAAGDACPADANKTTAGNCGCGNTEASCLDCAGTPNGDAFLDNCSICVGGTTGLTACLSTATINGTSANITVAPQPFDAATTITVQNYGAIQSYTIISASGALIETRQGLHTTEITLGDSIASGLYTVILTTEKGTFTTKIVKK